MHTITDLTGLPGALGFFSSPLASVLDFLARGLAFALGSESPSSLYSSPPFISSNLSAAMHNTLHSLCNKSVAVHLTCNLDPAFCLTRVHVYGVGRHT